MTDQARQPETAQPEAVLLQIIASDTDDAACSVDGACDPAAAAHLSAA